jgi:ATP-dependent DNA helicase RecG
LTSVAWTQLDIGLVLTIGTVAAFALWVAAKSGHQVALVCPTKILAEQHFQSLTSLLQPTGVTVGLLTAKSKESEAQIIIGTHAVFHWSNFKPALVVIDEEHRFGVEQRKHFFQHAKKPHFLSMTATPIPRTVALTALADYDVSVLQPHREANTVKTWVVPEEKRSEAYDWVKRHIDQAFVVCPFIDTSAIETLGSVKSASDEYDKLQRIFPEQKLTLLHGRMGEEDKTQVFGQMMEGAVDMLVTTPVVEVGVDIPRANIIIIEGAERFGLAQLHQLRGRVGRRGQPAFCLLFTSEGLGDPATITKRLHYFSQNYDGNALAEFDLKRRGSGELLGTRQHGFGSLQFASWFDNELIALCRNEVE